MSEQKSDFLKEKEEQQRRVVELNKMRQGLVDVPERVVVDATPKTKKEKWEHFWYYNKWYVIVAAILALFTALCISQCSNRTKYDYTAMLFCDYELSDIQTEDIADSLARFGEDVNGDGKVLVDVINCSYDKNTDYSARTSKTSKIQANLTNQEVLLYITDDHAFDYYTGTLFEDFFVNLNLPAKDGTAIILNDKFYQWGADDIGLPDSLTLQISRRAVANTTIENHKGVEQNAKNADKLLSNISAKIK